MQCINSALQISEEEILSSPYGQLYRTENMNWIGKILLKFTREMRRIKYKDFGLDTSPLLAYLFVKLIMA